MYTYISYRHRIDMYLCFASPTPTSRDTDPWAAQVPGSRDVRGVLIKKAHEMVRHPDT